MSNEYRHNHYVPVWYQKRFIPQGQVDNELYYLDLHPGVLVDPRGVVHQRKAVRRLGFKYCFAEQDLYTTRFGSDASTFIEQQFFGALDNHGRRSVNYYANFSHPWDGTLLFQQLLMYMSTQKLRTIKGLGWLQNKADTTDRNHLLRL